MGHGCEGLAIPPGVPTPNPRLLKSGTASPTLLLVYVQRVKQLTGQPQQQHPDDAGAAKPHSTAPGTSPAAPAAPPPPDQRAGAKPAAALADHRPEQRPEPQQQPPAVVAVSQLQEFGIPVPSLLQAAAHLMVVGALSPVQYQEVQAPFRLGLGRRLFCAVADQLPTSTELDCILPPMYGFSGVLYRMKDSAEVGAALWDGAVVRDLGPYTSAQDARKSIVMSIKLLAAANAAAPQPSGPAYTYGGALPGAPSLRSGPSVRSGGLRAAAVAAAAAAPPPLGGGARREPPPSGPTRDGVAGLGGHGDGLGRGGSRGVKANGRSGLGLGVPAVGAPGSGPGLPGAGPGGVGPDPAEADVLEAADQLLKLRSEGSGRIHMSNSPEPLPVVVAPAAAGVTALGGLVGAELGAPPLPPAVAAQLVAAPGKQRSLSALATADDPVILSPGLTAAAPTGVGLAAAANPTLPEAAGARAPTPSWAQQEHQRRDVAPVVDLTMTDVDTRSSVQQSPRGTNRMTPLVLKPGGGTSQVGSEAAALVALISSGRLQDMDRAELEALVAGSSGPALLAALQSLPQDLVAAATAAESGAGGHAMEADKGDSPGQAVAAPSQRQQQQQPHQQQLSEPAEQLLQRLQAGRAGGTLRLQQPGPGGDGRRMAAPMYGRPPGAAVGGGGGGGGGGSLSAHDGTGIYTTSGRTSSQPTYGASYSTHGSRGRDERGRAAGEAAFAGPSSSHGPFDRLGGISSSGAQGLGGLGSVMPLLGSGLSGLPPAGGVAPADDSPSGSGSGGGAARLGGPGGELDAATGADPALTRQRSGVTREFSAVTNLVGLGLQEALAIVRQRQGPHS
eukprot:XP_001698918.1 predicted protein [Chlamydomonas reinhardtii]